MKRRTSSDTLIPLRFASFRSAASWTSDRNIEMRFMLRIYKRHTLLSIKIRIPAENNSARRRRYQKTEIENQSLLRSAGGPWSSLVAAGTSAWGWGTGVPKGRPGGQPGPVSTREILGNLTLPPIDAGGLLRRANNYCSLAYSALACFRMGMSGSASFQRVKKV
jgi:hypothetical protein